MFFSLNSGRSVNIFDNKIFLFFCFIIIAGVIAGCFTVKNDFTIDNINQLVTVYYSNDMNSEFQQMWLPALFATCLPVIIILFLGKFRFGMPLCMLILAIQSFGAGNILTCITILNGWNSVKLWLLLFPPLLIRMTVVLFTCKGCVFSIYGNNDTPKSQQVNNDIQFQQKLLFWLLIVFVVSIFEALWVSLFSTLLK